LFWHLRLRIFDAIRFLITFTMFLQFHQQFHFVSYLYAFIFRIIYWFNVSLQKNDTIYLYMKKSYAVRTQYKQTPSWSMLIVSTIRDSCIRNTNTLFLFNNDVTFPFIWPLGNLLLPSVPTVQIDRLINEITLKYNYWI